MRKLMLTLALVTPFAACSAIDTTLDTLGPPAVVLAIGCAVSTGLPC